MTVRITKLEWDFDAWEDYLYWQTQDKKTLRRIHALIKDIKRHPFEGIGMAEPLKGNLSGFWSKRIDDANRLVYAAEGTTVIIIACRNHYA